MKRVWVAVMFTLAAIGCPATALAFDPGRVGFTVHVNGVPVDLDRFFTTAMPGAAVSLSLAKGRSARDFRLLAGREPVAPQSPTGWQWTAPGSPGVSHLSIEQKATGRVMHLTVFTLVPANRVVQGKLNGYRIGNYPDKPLRGLDVYRPPRGFIEVTKANANLPVSPHFTLAQFVCKQAGDYPKYLTLRPRLLLKLEGVLGEVNTRGIKADSLVVMSGYRTPYYNRLIGNVPYSRHQWGGAADIYIDVAPQDGQMDDVSGDGRVNRLDALWLYRLASRYAGDHRRKDLVGGVGVYNATSSHGPFVHVDVRGDPARWGE